MTSRKWKTGDMYTHEGSMYVVICGGSSIIFCHTKACSGEYTIQMAGRNWNENSEAVYLCNINKIIHTFVDAIKQEIREKLE